MHQAAQRDKRAAVFSRRGVRYIEPMETAFDPATFITSVMISYAQKHPVLHGIYVMFCLIVSVLPRALFEHPKYGAIFRLAGRLSTLAPRGAIGTLKLPGQEVRWPELPPPAPIPPTVRAADRPSVVRPPSSASEPHPSAAADDPTPVDGLDRATTVPEPIAAGGGAADADDPNA